MHLDSKQFYFQYDLDATTYKYGRLGDATGLPIQGKYGLTASSSVVTVTSPSGNAFSPVNVGDVIVLVNGETDYIRKVATKVSNAEITVDAVVADFTNKPGWSFYPFKIGNAAGDGWHAVQAYSEITILVKMGTVAAAGGVDLSIEGSFPNIGGVSVQLFTKNYAAGAAYEEPLIITERVQAIRVGLKGGSGFAGTDSITISMVGRVGLVGQ